MISFNLNGYDILNGGLYLSSLTITSGLLTELRNNKELPISSNFSNNLRASSYVIMACTLGKSYLYFVR